MFNYPYTVPNNICYMEEIFKNPETISGLTELCKRSKQQDKNIKDIKDVNEFLKNK